MVWVGKSCSFWCQTSKQPASHIFKVRLPHQTWPPSTFATCQSWPRCQAPVYLCDSCTLTKEPYDSIVSNWHDPTDTLDVFMPVKYVQQLIIKGVRSGAGCPGLGSVLMFHVPIRDDEILAPAVWKLLCNPLRMECSWVGWQHRRFIDSTWSAG